MKCKRISNEFNISIKKNINGNFEGRANGNIYNIAQIKDVNQNPLSFEYWYSKFKDYQVIT